MREGTHTGEATKACVKFAPRAARRSMFGVLISALPFAPTQSQRCWSVMMKRMFGFAFAGAAGAEAVARMQQARRELRRTDFILRKAAPLQRPRCPPCHSCM